MRVDYPCRAPDAISGPLSRSNLVNLSSSSSSSSIAHTTRSRPLSATGVAPCIVYEIKAALDELERSLETIRRGASPLARSLGIDAPRPSDRVKDWPYRTISGPYDRSMKMIFDFNLHRCAGNPKTARADQHVQRFRDVQARQEAEAEKQCAIRAAKVYAPR